MRPFSFEAVKSTDGAVQAAGRFSTDTQDPSPVQYLAGGTTLIDLMKLDVMRPTHVVDINELEASDLGRIEVDAKGLRLGALVRMAQAADNAEVVRNYPAIAQSLHLAASQQIRNMASLGGNVLQRTRCPYFRDVSYEQCNKRNPGSGCAALDGFNRSHAVLGTSDQCIATYPGDFAQALIALDAMVEIAGPRGERGIPFAALHRKPADAPNIETNLGPGEILTAFLVPNAAWSRRSVFVKIRDRESYEFALASAVVALDLDNRRVRDARIRLGWTEG
jgi:xanthine dehydrogenase YagS FAD-binding subunit